ncbi:hypothetical protein [Pseudaestuariivita rosea]|uniref:hypothetical protein n=1 Tax=Pseudaestuariivita rosea TaxID=2763263 RepID=UPI001ABAC497|nr:hypothetical protein [Pseudaestuariivita rosea]
MDALIKHSIRTLACLMVITVVSPAVRADTSSSADIEYLEEFRKLSREVRCASQIGPDCNGAMINNPIKIVPYEPDPNKNLNYQRNRIPKPKLLSGPPWPECHSIYEITADMTPVYLNEQIISCAQAENYKNMGEMMIALEVFHTFDMKRLQLFGSHPNELKNEQYRRRFVTRSDYLAAKPYRETLWDAKRSDPELQKATCDFFNDLGPPTNDLSWTTPVFEYLEMSPNRSSTPGNILWAETLNMYLGCSRLTN